MSLPFLKSYRITVFIPAGHAQAYIEKIQDHIPSFLGEYDRVLWFSDVSQEQGFEQYRAKNTNVGKNVSRETEQEHSMKIEFSIPYDDTLCARLTRDLLVPAHPWEEPVILVQEARIYNHE